MKLLLAIGVGVAAIYGATWLIDFLLEAKRFNKPPHPDWNAEQEAVGRMLMRPWIDREGKYQCGEPDYD